MLKYHNFAAETIDMCLSGVMKAWRARSSWLVAGEFTLSEELPVSLCDEHREGAVVVFLIYQDATTPMMSSNLNTFAWDLILNTKTWVQVLQRVNL